MENKNIDISNPNNFVWKGSIIHDFDKDTSLRLSHLRKETHSALSRKKRKNYSKNKLISLKSHLEFLANLQLLQLDLYSAALKHDNRDLSTINVGIAASIDDATSKKTSSNANYQNATEKQKKEFEEEEQSKSQKFQKEIEELENKAAEKRKEVERLEKEANYMKMQAERKKVVLNQYKEYNEWVALNNKLISVSRKRKDLENSMLKTKANPNRYLPTNETQEIPERYYQNAPFRNNNNSNNNNFYFKRLYE